MKNSEDSSDASVDSELEALIVELRHARHSLHQGRRPEIGGLLPRLKQVTACVADRSSASSTGKPSLLLALADELKGTIGAFGMAREELREELRMASRSLMAGAAYRRLHDG